MQLSEMIIQWSSIKNNWLKENRQITFEEIEIMLLQGDYIEIRTNPSDKYPNQYLVLLKVVDYICVVPFVINKTENIIFLKTIYKSRKYNKSLIKNN